MSVTYIHEGTEVDDAHDESALQVDEPHQSGGASMGANSNFDFANFSDDALSRNVDSLPFFW